MGAHLSAEQAQHFLHLAPLLDDQLPQGIAQPHGDCRLHENRGAGVGNIVDDALDIVAVFHFNQNNVAAFPLGDDIFLEDTTAPRRPDDALQVLHDLPAGLPELRPDGGQRRRGRIQDFTGRVQAGDNIFLDLP